jgi:hypothetical protein
MRCRFACVGVLAFLGVLALALSASADTLEMKDRRVINGKYLGGTQSHVRFLVNGKVELYPTEEIVALTFGGDARQADEQPALAAKSADSVAEMSNRGASQSVTVPAGTRLLIRMIDSVDSATNKVGDRFRASLEEPLVIGSTVVAPKGADVYGRLGEAKAAGKISGQSDLKLELTGITVNQQLQAIVTGDYDVAGKSRGKQSAERIAGGAVVGTIIGAIAGGGKGAAIGAGVGAGAGTAVQVLTKGQQVKVPSETLLEFTLEQPLTVQLPASTGR